MPRHRAPDVVVESGLTEDGYVPVDPATLATPLPGRLRAGRRRDAGHAEGRRVRRRSRARVATSLIAQIRGGGPAGVHAGTGSCYIEFGGDRIGRVDIDFLSGPSPKGTYWAPSVALRAEKQEFGASRRARWFGRTS